jgi:nucleotide-binding universal stress UspA family protein
MCGAAVTAVLVWHVEVEGGVVVTERSSERWAAVEHRYESLGHRVTDPASDRHPGVEVDIKVLHGSPAKTLVEVGHGADLMVVGGRRRGGFRGLLLGSVSRRVVEHAPCAVAVVH